MLSPSAPAIDEEQFFPQEFDFMSWPTEPTDLFDSLVWADFSQGV